MSPWTVLGWILVAAIVLPLLYVVLAFLVMLAKDHLAARKTRRAHEGKVKCWRDSCGQIATWGSRRDRFYCDEHRPRISQSIYRLDHARGPQ